MVKIKIRTSVWNLHRKACAVQGIKSHGKMIEILESMLFGDSWDILNDHERERKDKELQARVFSKKYHRGPTVQELIASKAYMKQRVLDDFLRSSEANPAAQARR